MTPEQILEEYRNLPNAQKPQYLRTLTQGEREELAKSLPPIEAEIVRMPDDQRDEFEEQIRIGTAQIEANRQAREPADIAPVQGLDRHKSAFVQAFQATQGEVPVELLEQVDQVITMEAWRQFLTEFRDAVPDGGATINTYFQIENSDSEFRAIGEDETLLTQLQGGQFVDPATGEIVANPTGARGSGTEQFSNIPEVEVEDTRTFLGSPPEGFEAGVGIDGTLEERQTAMRNMQDRRRELQVQMGGDRIDQGSYQMMWDGGTMEMRYYEGEEWSFAWKHPGLIRVYQQRMSEAGILKPNTYSEGIWDAASAGAMGKVMTAANARGITWDFQLRDMQDRMDPEMLKELYGASSRSGSRTPFVAPAYRKPDNASLSQAVKALLRQRLKREPSRREMAELTQQMNSDYKVEYDADVQALRNEYNAQSAAMDSGASQTAAPVQNVDPSARFREAFEQRFANEITLNEDSDDWTQRNAKMQSAMGSLDAMIGF